MPVKVDTRKKTHKQKEKNKRRKKRNHSRKGPSLFERIRSSLGINQTPKSRKASRSKRSPSRQAIHGVVANAYASRMPVGSNHTKGNYATTQTGLSSKNFFKRTLRQMKRAQKQDLPPTYSYQNRPRPIYPEEIHVQPIGLAEPSKSLHNALRALPATSMPRGHRQSLLREAHAEPIGTGLAEPGMPNWGQMYEATEEGRPRVTRAMTAAELGKEDAYTRVQADMRTGGPGPTMGIWAPSRVRRPENHGVAVVANGSISSRESARRDGRRRLSMAEEHAFLQHFPQRIDLVTRAKTNTPAGQQARAQLRELTNSVFSNANSSISSHGSEASYSLTPSERIDINRLANLTPEEIERLRLLGLEHMVPGPEVQGVARYTAISEIRHLFRYFNTNGNNGSTSTIHTEYSNADDPLHLTAVEILLLRRQGPEGVEHIRLATSSASAEITMDQVAEARAFLAGLPQRSRSRSGSRSTLSRRSGESNTSELSVYNPDGMHLLRGPGMGLNEDPIHLTTREEELLRAHGPEGIEYIDAVRTTADHHARMYRVAEARNFLDTIRRTTGIGYQAMHAAAFPGSSDSSPSSLGSAEILTHSPPNTLTPLSSIGSLNSRGSRGSRSSRGSRGSRSSRGSRGSRSSRGSRGSRSSRGSRGSRGSRRP